MSAESSESPPHSYYPSSEQFGVVDEEDSHGESSESTDDEDTEPTEPPASQVDLEPSSPAQLKGELFILSVRMVSEVWFIFTGGGGPGTGSKLLKAMRDALVVGILSFMVTQIMQETGHSRGIVIDT